MAVPHPRQERDRVPPGRGAYKLLSRQQKMRDYSYRGFMRSAKRRMGRSRSYALSSPLNRLPLCQRG
jgi:hypothetical protein